MPQVTRRRPPEDESSGGAVTSRSLRRRLELARNVVAGDRADFAPGAIDAGAGQRLLSTGVAGVDVVADEANSTVAHEAVDTAGVTALRRQDDVVLVAVIAGFRADRAVRSQNGVE